MKGWYPGQRGNPYSKRRSESGIGPRPVLCVCIIHTLTKYRMASLYIHLSPIHVIIVHGIAIYIPYVIYCMFNTCFFHTLWYCQARKTLRLMGIQRLAECNSKLGLKRFQVIFGDDMVWETVPRLDTTHTKRSFAHISLHSGLMYHKPMAS